MKMTLVISVVLNRKLSIPVGSPAFRPIPSSTTWRDCWFCPHSPPSSPRCVALRSNCLNWKFDASFVTDTLCFHTVTVILSFVVSVQVHDLFSLDHLCSHVQPCCLWHMSLSSLFCDAPVRLLWRYSDSSMHAMHLSYLFFCTYVCKQRKWKSEKHQYWTRKKETVGMDMPVR